MILNACNTVMMMLLMIAVGFWAAGKPWFGDQGAGVFSKCLVHISIPCYLVSTLLERISSREQMIQIFFQVPIPAISILLSLGVASILAHLLHIKRGRKSIFTNAAGLSNTIIIGFPIVIALFGEDAAFTGMSYYMANTLIFWALGVLLIRQEKTGSRFRVDREMFRGIFSPPMIALLLGMLVVFSGIRLPFFLQNAISTIGKANSPMAMIFIGGIMRRSNIRDCGLGRDTWVLLLMRFLCAPAIMLLLLKFFPVAHETQVVFFVLSTMPAMTQLGIMAKEYDCDYAYASMVITLTTAVSLVAIPLYSIFIEYAPTWVWI